MRAWTQEIELILRGELDEAAKMYHEHRPDLSPNDAEKIVRGVAKTMNIAISRFEKKLEVQKK